MRLGKTDIPIAVLPDRWRCPVCGGEIAYGIGAVRIDQPRCTGAHPATPMERVAGFSSTTSGQAA